MEIDSSIFGKIWTYRDVFSYLSSGSKTKEEIKNHLKSVGKTDVTANDYCRKLDSIPFVMESESRYLLVQDDLIAALLQTCADLNLEAVIEAKKKKKVKPEDEIATVTTAHSKSFQDAKEIKKQETKRRNVLKEKYEKKLSEKDQVIKGKDEKLAALVAELETAKATNIVEAFDLCMDKQINIQPLVESDPPMVLAKDFFYCNPSQELDKVPLVSKNGGMLGSIYQVVDEPEKVFTEENFFKRIFQRFASGRMLKNRLETQEKLKEEKKPDRDLDDNRRRSIEMLLTDETLDNQTKLATYAFWYFSDDPEMYELLNFAGQHAINANYVIRLLEKPAEYQNYRTVRAFLNQTQMASEAHIKRETVQELLCGDWQVIAEYCGKQCHFRLLPLEELDAFRNILHEHNTLMAEKKIEYLLNSTFGPMDQKLEEEDKTVSKDIEPPSFLHEMPSGMEVPPDKEVADESYEHFSEKEQNTEGKEELPFE